MPFSARMPHACSIPCMCTGSWCSTTSFPLALMGVCVMSESCTHMSLLWLWLTKHSVWLSFLCVVCSRMSVCLRNLDSLWNGNGFCLAVRLYRCDLETNVLHAAMCALMVGFVLNVTMLFLTWSTGYACSFIPCM